MDRSSTETTIFTIYSMYGNDERPPSELDVSLGDSFAYDNRFFQDPSPLPNSLVNPHDSRKSTLTSSSDQSSHPLPDLPPTSSLAPPSKRHSRLTPPSSKTSLVPSEGEDPDSFHVRNIYAQLDATGVRGDGFQDGIERTRARQRASRLNELRGSISTTTSDSATDKSGDLLAEEVSVLTSLDRYGFFTVASHDRLVRLPSLPLLRRFSTVSAGPKTASSHAMSVTSLPPPSSPSKEADRIAKWGRMMQVYSRDRGGNVESWAIKPSKVHKLRRRVYKGIPDRWRSAAWEVLMNTFSKSGYDQIAKLTQRYRSDMEKPSSYDIQIDLDVPRTISGHILFRTRYGLGQRSLFHVLHSFSLRCEHCGYVQGMGPIAATLLCYFRPDKVYAALTRLHDAYAMHSIFSPGFPGLLETIYVQERIMQLKMPHVYAAFKKHMISTTSYATKWYITLFANSVPFQTQLRIWDAFLLDGNDVFVAVAIAIVWVYRDHITSTSASFETVLSLLSSFFIPEDEDALLSWIEQLLADTKLREQMRSWRRNWHQLVASGQEGNALL